MLVGRLWMSVCESPKFWTEWRLKERELNFSQVMQSRIIKLVPDIWLRIYEYTTINSRVQEAVEMIEQLFRAIQQDLKERNTRGIS